MNTPEPQTVVSVDIDALVLTMQTLRTVEDLLAACSGLPPQALTAARLVRLASNRLASMGKGRPVRWE
jgi:hypothetical protein